MSILDNALEILQLSVSGRAVLEHIDALKAENERFKEALEWIADSPSGGHRFDSEVALEVCVEKAKAALQQKEG